MKEFISYMKNLGLWQIYSKAVKYLTFVLAKTDVYVGFSVVPFSYKDFSNFFYDQSSDVNQIIW